MAEIILPCSCCDSREPGPCGFNSNHRLIGVISGYGFDYMWNNIGLVEPYIDKTCPTSNDDIYDNQLIIPDGYYDVGADPIGLNPFYGDAYRFYTKYVGVFNGFEHFFGPMVRVTVSSSYNATNAQIASDWRETEIEDVPIDMLFNYGLSEQSRWCWWRLNWVHNKWEFSEAFSKYPPTPPPSSEHWYTGDLSVTNRWAINWFFSFTDNCQVSSGYTYPTPRCDSFSCVNRGYYITRGGINVFIQNYLGRTQFTITEIDGTSSESGV